MIITKSIISITIKKTGGKKGILFLFVFYFLLPFATGAQTIDSSAYKLYTFIRKDLNKIQNDSTSLAFLYEKLYQLEKTKTGRVNIAHIGDSHIQADIFSGLVRQKMQLKFGNAGRGLIFPYRLAKSNEPNS